MAGISRKQTAATLALVLTLLLAVAVPRVIASNWGSQCGTVNGVDTCVSLANNGGHLVIFYSVEANQRNATLWSMANNYNPTDMTVQETTYGGTADVGVYDYTYGANGIWGWVHCPPNNTGVGGAHPNRWCRGQTLKYNLSYPGAFDTDFERRYMACHEMGHTVGLRHSGNTASCMYANVATSNYLDAHDNSHINAQY